MVTQLSEMLYRHLAESRDPSASEILRAEAAARATHQRLDQALLELGIVTASRLKRLLGEFGIKGFRTQMRPAEAVLAEVLKPDFLETARVLPLKNSADAATIGMVDPFDDFTAKAISLKLGSRVERVQLEYSDFKEMLETLYDRQLDGGDITDGADAYEATSADVEVLRESASDAPVIKFVQRMISDALRQGASDIHVRPHQTGPKLKFRLDGVLVDQPPPDVRMLPAVISRLKVLANLDISERRVPQDGRFRASVAGRAVDMRLSTMPHVLGEGAVVRLLAREAFIDGIADLGFSAHIERSLDRLLGVSEGLVLVTGPTGSGKSTTLYAALHKVMRPDLNVVTVEDPVEYRIDGAAQVQVDDKVGLTFARVLRSLLRQDPDVILVGEIRDPETAKIAVQAALTGHLVLATLHTNTALAAIPRLIDMGIDSYLISAVLRGVLSQRLLRKACSTCGGAGCAACHGTGYAGRVAIGELALLSPALIDAVTTKSQDEAAIEAELRKQGYLPISEDAALRVLNREADETEVARVLGADG